MGFLVGYMLFITQSVMYKYKHLEYCIVPTDRQNISDIDEIKVLHTQTLMDMLEATRKHDKDAPPSNTIIGFRYQFLYRNNAYRANAVELKDILKTRPHLPNKQERKRARQNKAKN